MSRQESARLSVSTRMPLRMGLCKTTPDALHRIALHCIALRYICRPCESAPISARQKKKRRNRIKISRGQKKGKNKQTKRTTKKKKEHADERVSNSRGNRLKNEKTHTYMHGWMEPNPTIYKETQTTAAFLGSEYCCTTRYLNTPVDAGRQRQR